MTAVLRPGPTGLYTEHDVEFCPELRAAGHNPHGLIVAQVGAGWRLLAEEEIIAERRLHGGDRYAIEAWIGSGWDATGWAGNEAMYTYRTKQPPGYYSPFEAEAAEVVAEKVRKKLAELPATDAEATPPPAGTKYVHTFVCHGCKLDCTVEAVTDTPTTKTEPDRCLFVGLAPWHLEATHTLTP